MELAAKIWWRAIVIYFFLNLPALVMPAIFIISLGLAIVCSLPALVLFLPVPGLLRRAGLIHPAPAFIFITSIGMTLCYLATCHACYIMKDDYQTTYEAMQEWLVFPAIAWAAALISIVTHYSAIKQYFHQQILAPETL